MLRTHSANSRSKTTAINGPQGQAATGGSVLLNFQIPTHKEPAAATPATESIHSFVAGDIPGTISIVAMKSKKIAVVAIDEIQYIQNLTRLLRNSPE